MRLGRLACGRYGTILCTYFFHTEFLGNGTHRHTDHARPLLVELVDLKSNDVCNRSSCVRRVFLKIHARMPVPKHARIVR